MFDDELTPAERDAFRALPREAQAGDLLEERTVRALAAHGLVRPAARFGGRRRFAWAVAAAACALFFLAGFRLGQGRGGSGTDPRVATPQRDVPAPAGRRAGGTDVAVNTPDSIDAATTRYVVWF